MARSASFDFLKTAWGIELQSQAQEEIEANAESLSKRHVEEYIKDSDIRKIPLVSRLPKEIARLPNGNLPSGQFLVQVQKIADITQPAKFQEEFEGGKWRLLAIDLVDGDQKFRAIEYSSLPAKVFGVHLPPGTKLLLYSTERAPIRVRNGHLLLVPDAMEVLGGNVERLVESWRASKEVEATRLLWRTEGVKKKPDGEGAPRWVDFDPKKAVRRGNDNAQRRAAEEERVLWRKEGSNPSKGPAVKDNGDKEDGPRFQKADFADEGAVPQVKNQISSSVFAKDPNGPRPKGEGKGEKGKGKGKGKDEAGHRRGRFDDYDGGEEKRAPTAGAATLAAFIKPTKKGELPDEALAALTEPAAPAAAAGAGAGWDQSSWDAGGWDQGWSGGGGGGWSGGGWSGGGGKGRGGSKGGGKGGGHGGGKGGRKGGYGGKRH